LYHIDDEENPVQNGGLHIDLNHQHRKDDGVDEHALCNSLDPTEVVSSPFEIV